MSRSAYAHTYALLILICGVGGVIAAVALSISGAEHLYHAAFPVHAVVTPEKR